MSPKESCDDSELGSCQELWVTSRSLSRGWEESMNGFRGDMSTKSCRRAQEGSGEGSGGLRRAQVRAQGSGEGSGGSKRL